MPAPLDILELAEDDNTDVRVLRGGVHNRGTDPSASVAALLGWNTTTQ